MLDKGGQFETLVEVMYLLQVKHYGTIATKNLDFRHDVQIPNPSELPGRLIPTDVNMGLPGS